MLYNKTVFDVHFLKCNFMFKKKSGKINTSQMRRKTEMNPVDIYTHVFINITNTGVVYLQPKRRREKTSAQIH